MLSMVNIRKTVKLRDILGMELDLKIQGKYLVGLRYCVCAFCPLLPSHVQLFYSPMDCGSPGSSVHGILQTRKLEWVGLPFPLLGDLPNPGIELVSLVSTASPALEGRF